MTIIYPRHLGIGFYTFNITKGVCLILRVLSVICLKHLLYVLLYRFNSIFSYGPSQIIRSEQNQVQQSDAENTHKIKICLICITKETFTNTNKIYYNDNLPLHYLEVCCSYVHYLVLHQRTFNFCTYLLILNK